MTSRAQVALVPLVDQLKADIRCVRDQLSAGLITPDDAQMQARAAVSVEALMAITSKDHRLLGEIAALTNISATNKGKGSVHKNKLDLRLGLFGIPIEDESDASVEDSPNEDADESDTERKYNAAPAAPTAPQSAQPAPLGASVSGTGSAVRPAAQKRVRVAQSVHPSTTVPESGAQSIESQLLDRINVLSARVDSLTAEKQRQVVTVDQRPPRAADSSRRSLSYSLDAYDGGDDEEDAADAVIDMRKTNPIDTTRVKSDRAHFQSQFDPPVRSQRSVLSGVRALADMQSPRRARQEVRFNIDGAGSKRSDPVSAMGFDLADDEPAVDSESEANVPTPRFSTRSHRDRPSCSNNDSRSARARTNTRPVVSALNSCFRIGSESKNVLHVRSLDSRGKVDVDIVDALLMAESAGGLVAFTKNRTWKHQRNMHEAVQHAIALELMMAEQGDAVVETSIAFEFIFRRLMGLQCYDYSGEYALAEAVALDQGGPLLLSASTMKQMRRYADAMHFGDDEDGKSKDGSGARGRSKSKFGSTSRVGARQGHSGSSDTEQATSGSYPGRGSKQQTRTASSTHASASVPVPAAIPLIAPASLSHVRGGGAK